MPWQNGSDPPTTLSPETDYSPTASTGSSVSPTAEVQVIVTPPSARNCDVGTSQSQRGHTESMQLRNDAIRKVEGFLHEWDLRIEEGNRVSVDGKYNK
jgi:hypothetical protein